MSKTRDKGKAGEPILTAEKAEANTEPRASVSKSGETKVEQVTAALIPPKPPEISKLKNPDKILFVAQSKIMSQNYLPAVLMTYNQAEPPAETLFPRFECLIIDREKGKKHSWVELTFLFNKDEKEGISERSSLIEVTQLRMKLLTSDTDVFFEEYEKAEKFVWTVSTINYSFSATISKANQEVEIAQIESRQLH